MHVQKYLDSKVPFIIFYFLREWAEYMVQASEDDVTAALSEAGIQASPMYGCVSVAMFRVDEISATKKEYMFDLRL